MSAQNWTPKDWTPRELAAEVIRGTLEEAERAGSWAKFIRLRESAFQFAETMNIPLVDVERQMNRYPVRVGSLRLAGFPNYWGNEGKLVIGPQLYVEDVVFHQSMQEAGLQAEVGPFLRPEQYAEVLQEERRNRVLAICACGVMDCGATYCRSEFGEWMGVPGEMLFDFSLDRTGKREHESVVPFAVFLPDLEWQLVCRDWTFLANDWPMMPLAE